MDYNASVINSESPIMDLCHMKERKEEKHFPFPLELFKHEESRFKFSASCSSFYLLLSVCQVYGSESVPVWRLSCETAFSCFFVFFYLCVSLLFVLCLFLCESCLSVMCYVDGVFPSVSLFLTKDFALSLFLSWTKGFTLYLLNSTGNIVCIGNEILYRNTQQSITRD